MRYNIGMKALSIPTFDASKFTWHGGVGSCEAPTLGLKPGEVPYGHDYSEDVMWVDWFGPSAVMVLRNPKKGTECKFYLTESTSSCWRFESADRKILAIVWDT
jgi:hypothetical protein